jgi:hypothetical protein
VRGTYKVLLLVEVLVCFAPMTSLWVMGALLTPFVVASSFLAGWSDDAFWEAPALLLGFVGCGFCGLVSLVHVLGKLLGRQRPVKRPATVLVGTALGVLPILPFLLIPGSWKLAALAPLASTAHLIYLGRGMLFAHRDRRRSERLDGSPEDFVGSPRAHETGVRAR